MFKWIENLIDKSLMGRDDYEFWKYGGEDKKEFKNKLKSFRNKYHTISRFNSLEKLPQGMIKAFNKYLDNEFISYNDEFKPLFRTKLHYNDDNNLIWVASSYKPKPLWTEVMDTHVLRPNNSIGLKIEEESTSKKDNDIADPITIPTTEFNDSLLKVDDFLGWEKWISANNNNQYTQKIKGYDYSHGKSYGYSISAVWNVQQMCLSDTGFYMTQYLPKDIDPKSHIIFFKDPNGKKQEPMMLTYSNEFKEEYGENKILFHSENTNNVFYLDKAHTLRQSFIRYQPFDTASYAGQYSTTSADGEVSYHQNYVTARTGTSPVYEAKISIPDTIENHDLELVNYTVHIDTSTWGLNAGEGVYGPLCNLEEIIYYDKDEITYDNKVQSKTYTLNDFLKTYENAKKVVKSSKDPQLLKEVKDFLHHYDLYLKTIPEVEKGSLKTKFEFVCTPTAKWNLFTLFCYGISLDKQFKKVKIQEDDRAIRR